MRTKIFNKKCLCQNNIMVMMESSPVHEGREGAALFSGMTGGFLERKEYYAASQSTVCVCVCVCVHDCMCIHVHACIYIVYSH